MQIHALDFNDVIEEYYSLIGIHTTLQDYKLAYHLNRTIKANFSKSLLDLELNKNNHK